MGKIFGYARVSTQDQNLDLQIDALKKSSVAVIYKEKMTGTKKERPELEQLLKAISEGDSVVVYKLDRISRSTKHLIELAETFEEKKVNFISIQDSIDTSTAMGRFFFRTMASIAELERDIISERTKSGLQSARMRGRNGGRPSKDHKLVERALKLHSSKQYSIKEITDMTGVSKSVLYRALEKI
ncbi:recombinase family protein [Paenibacillus illinoisensis]|uniref:Resolvase n=1 Tax=Paenibacillus illinoisensis TaxID=59845 RepID=A0A2W0CNK0_9BACL|nr:recombinase family protein [Paenibacillus illinoisensis]PYY29775.1 Resolvase [Paenibacillus illinoisensis]